MYTWKNDTKGRLDDENGKPFREDTTKVLTSGEKWGDFARFTFKRNKKKRLPHAGEPFYLNYNRLIS